jgi:hypothetical protein
MALEFVQVASDPATGVTVHQSTESFEAIDAKALAEALKTFEAASISASAGGPVVVRTQQLPEEGA